MADQDMLHTADIVKAALPFIDNKSRTMAELFVKVFELMGSFRTIRSSSNMAACGYDAGKIDLEGLLNGIRPVCSNKEREMVDRFLSFFNMRKMIEMYNNLMETMKTMQEFGGFPFGDTGNEADSDNVTGNFGGLNFESIFKNFQNSSSSDSTQAADEFQTKEAEEDKDFTETSNDNKTNSANSGFGSKDTMFEMLKTMVPPDKLSTFENLSMLLNTMSYDNSSKPENKERNDG